eukprot:TRINITY_DN14789_c0_g1_i1.p2 TRINITY_DN14789_c0_g1~~TRINITY_DN14789_c0_g1_i1.p2  ORF type:complete len:195 (+),score=36.04 TRINITY_DN14789_c0_g1_i1:60-644(+)
MHILAAGTASQKKLASLQALPSIGSIKKELRDTFIHAIIDSICGKELNFVSLFGAADNLAVLGSIIGAYVIFVQDAVRLGLTREQIVEDLNEASVPEADLIATAIVGRQELVRAHLVKRSAEISYNHLVDFDWALSLTLGSNQRATMLRPSVQLQLKLADAAGKPQDVLLELTRDRLDKTIEALEQACSVSSRV